MRLSVTWYRSLWERLLAIPLYYKILITNALILIGGASIGTVLIIIQVRRSPESLPLEWIAMPVMAGLIFSLIINSILLRAALLPLDRLIATAQSFRAGDVTARVPRSSLHDPETDELADTLNYILDALEERATTIERYTAQLEALSAKVMSAQEEERKRIARELHDETGQALTSLVLGLRALHTTTSLEEAHQRTEELLAQARQALDGVHRLALELRPSTLDDLGLVPALRQCTSDFSRNLRIPINFEARGFRGRLQPHVEIALYRIVQEALTNIAKHAQATQISVTLEHNGESVRAMVTDNGRGFDLKAILDSGDLDRGLGLFGMQERASLLGGSFTIDTDLGRGTSICVEVPLVPRPVAT